MNLRRLGPLAVIMVIILLTSSNAMAAEQITVTVDGKWLELDIPPALEDGRLLVPVRALLEATGGSVAWDEVNRTVTVTAGKAAAKLTIGAKSAEVNDRKVQLDVPVRIIQGRTMVPLRFVAEALNGALVTWFDDSKSVVVLTPAFVRKEKESLLKKSQTADPAGVQAAHLDLGEDFSKWRALLNLTPWITEANNNLFLYQIWFPENETRQFVVRTVNRVKSGDMAPYSEEWLSTVSYPVKDIVAYIDLTENRFDIKWVAYLTPDEGEKKIPLGDEGLDKYLKYYLGDEYGYLQTYGQKPDFGSKLRGYYWQPGVPGLAPIWEAKE